MENRNNQKNSKIALAILAGVAAGAAAWYFMHTENGKQNWSNLVGAVKDVSDKLINTGTEKVSQLSSLGKDASEYLATKVDGLMHDVKNYS